MKIHYPAKLYDSFQLGCAIYDLSFVDNDKILPFTFSSAVGWQILQVKGAVQTRKGLRCISRHLETRRGGLSFDLSTKIIQLLVLPIEVEDRKHIHIPFELE